MTAISPAAEVWGRHYFETDDLLANIDVLNDANRLYGPSDDRVTEIGALREALAAAWPNEHDMRTPALVREFAEIKMKTARLDRALRLAEHRRLGRIVDALRERGVLD